MKYLKKYESFTDIATASGVVLGIAWLISLGAKYISNKKDKDLVFYILRNLPTTGNSSYSVNTTNNIMILKQKTHHLEKDIIKLDLSTKELSYYVAVDFEQTISIKLDKSDFVKIKLSLKFIDDVNKEVDICFQEVKDCDYTIRIYDYDFLKRTFKVEIISENSPMELNIIIDGLNRFLLMCDVELIKREDDGYIYKSPENNDDFILHGHNNNKKVFNIENYNVSLSQGFRVNMSFKSK